MMRTCRCARHALHLHALYGLNTQFSFAYSVQLCIGIGIAIAIAIAIISGLDAMPQDTASVLDV